MSAARPVIGMALLQQGKPSWADQSKRQLPHLFWHLWNEQKPVANMGIVNCGA